MKIVRPSDRNDKNCFLAIAIALLTVLAPYPALANPHSSPMTSNTAVEILPPEASNPIQLAYGSFSKKDPMEMHPLIPPAKNLGAKWVIYKTHWDEEDEKGYQAFITAIGRSNCNSLDDCLRNAANPYRDLEDDDIYLGDCADMAYFMRGYYAWKNGLPWSYQYQMRTASGKNEDLRYSTSGNVVAGRRDVLARVGQPPITAKPFLMRIGGEVSTAMFRTHPVTGGGDLFDDFYSVDITREAIVPGSVAYDVFGHVGIVYEIEEDGRVMIVASHPDQSVTRSTYGANFMRTGPEFGGGLKAWRPISVVGAKQLKDGSYKGGKIVAAKNEEIENFSLVQYYGNHPDPHGDWTLGEFKLDGRTLKYYDWVKRKLAAPDYAINPIKELRHSMRTICSDLRARKAAVDRAQREKIHLKDHPGKLPPNIYGTYGTWEAYSTPSRDARLKTSFLEIRTTTADLVEKFYNDEGGVDFYNDDLAGALLHAFDEEKEKCRISYKRMDGSIVILNLGHIMDRLWDISFDPYHCPERRWGAKGYELSTCIETEEKKAWYEAEQYLRNQVERTYDQKMGFTLEEIKSPDEAAPDDGGLGVAMPPDIHLKKYLLPWTKRHNSTELEPYLRHLKYTVPE
ncbi:MAG: hypothetical protein ACWA5L_05695 [bacterium]